jgi:hypothetical protein
MKFKVEPFDIVVVSGERCVPWTQLIPILTKFAATCCPIDQANMLTLIIGMTRTIAEAE